MRELFIKEAQSGNLMGHFRVQKTLDIVMYKIFYHNMKHDVERIHGQCRQCEHAKSTTRAQGKYIALPTPNGPWTDISMDFIFGTA